MAALQSAALPQYREEEGGRGGRKEEGGGGGREGKEGGGREEEGPIRCDPAQSHNRHRRRPDLRHVVAAARCIRRHSNPHDEVVVLRARFKNPPPSSPAIWSKDMGKIIAEVGTDIHAGISEDQPSGSLFYITGFLIAVHPDLAIISVGKAISLAIQTNNLDRLRWHSTKRTDRDGTIDVVVG